MSNDERALTDGAPEPAEREAALDEFIDDVTEIPAPEDYDFAAMVAGVKPNRARVRIRPRSDLYARLEELAEEIRALPTDDDVPDDLAAEWSEVKADYDRTFVVVVEGRSSDWVKQFTKDVKARGINPTRKGLSDEERVKHTERLWHAQIAEQTVHPTQGVTADAVAALFRANEPEADKLWRALQRVNGQPSGVAPDFSRRRSERNPSG